MAAPLIPSAELKTMCENAERVARMCGTLGLGDPRVSEVSPMLLHYGHEHPFLAGDHDPDTDPYIWETE